MKMRSIKSLMDMKGRRALITGGSGFIALAIEEAFIELGAKVALLDLDSTACERRARDLNRMRRGAAIPLPCDLMDEFSTRQAVRRAVKQMGGLDILVHAAAYVSTTQYPGWAVPFPKQTAEALNRAFRVNLTSAFILIQEARTALERSGRGSVILIGSTYGVVGPNPSLYTGTTMVSPVGYGTSKGALIQMARILSTQLAPKIRVNALTPGGVFRRQPRAFVNRYESRTPLGRMAREEDFKGAAVFLASDLSGYVTGQNILVDGGWTAW